MKLAVVGSRGLNIDSLEPYVPPGVTEIVSGGARGVDTCAAAYAQTHGLKLTVFLPEYTRYGRSAPLCRNREIVAYADAVLALWDGASRGTAFVIREAGKQQKPLTIISLPPEG